MRWILVNTVIRQTGKGATNLRDEREYFWFWFEKPMEHDSSALKIVVGGLYSNRAGSQLLTFCIVGKYRLFCTQTPLH